MGLETEFVYDDPQKENLEIYLEEPFRTPIMARFQSGLEDHQTCISAMFPRAWYQDAVFSITVDHMAGFEMIRAFDLQCVPHVPSARSWVQLYSNIPMESLHLLGDSFHQATIHSSTYKLASGSRYTCVAAFVLSNTDIILGRGSEEGSPKFKITLIQ